MKQAINPTALSINIPVYTCVYWHVQSRQAMGQATFRGKREHAHTC